MAVLIFKLRYVPEDEAYEVRELLHDNNIDFYETSAGFFGIGVPGLWLNNNKQRQQAKQLIDEYQQSRHNKARDEYALQLSQGTARTFWDMFKAAPIRYITIVLAIILIGFVMIFTFIKI